MWKVGFMHEMDSLRSLLHLWSFPQQQGFPFAKVVCFFFLHLLLPEMNLKLAPDMEEKAVLLLG